MRKTFKQKILEESKSYSDLISRDAPWSQRRLRDKEISDTPENDSAINLSDKTDAEEISTKVDGLKYADVEITTADGVVKEKTFSEKMREGKAPQEFSKY